MIHILKYIFNLHFLFLSQQKGPPVAVELEWKILKLKRYGKYDNKMYFVILLNATNPAQIACTAYME